MKNLPIHDEMVPKQKKVPAKSTFHLL